MELNKEMRQSIIDETTKIFGTQLPDELLDEISGGRPVFESSHHKSLRV